MVASWLKGLIVGAVTVAVAALVIAMYSMVREGTANPIPLFAVVLFIGALPGLAVGAIAGLVAERLKIHRRLALCAIAIFGVTVLGAITVPDLIPIGAVPAISAALVLEGWTRENLAARRSPPQPMAPVLVGMIIGVANAAVAAFALALIDQVQQYRHGHTHSHAFELAIALFVVGSIVALPLGAVIGLVAGALATSTTTTRRLVLGALAGSCLLLGPIGDIPLELFLPAFPSTLVAALILERLTRRAPPLPPARALV